MLQLTGVTLQIFVVNQYIQDKIVYIFLYSCCFCYSWNQSWPI